jgi:hypothetical protein
VTSFYVYTALAEGDSHPQVHDHHDRAAGWEVRDEQDSRVIRWVRYSDWHRVERARMAFALEAALLEESGWDEA